MKRNYFKTVVSIDIREIEKDIFCEHTGASRNVKYLVCNKKTFERLAANSNVLIEHDPKLHHEFCGVPIAVCNNLQDGEIDIV